MSATNKLTLRQRILISNFSSALSKALYWTRVSLLLLGVFLKPQQIDADADELEWYIPAAILPSDLQSYMNVINQFLEKPLDLGGKKATQLLSKKTKRRRRRAVSDDEGEAQLNSDDDEPRQKKAKKKKEKETYKSAQFIEDSDAEIDDEAFWARERAQRERTALLAADGKVTNMRTTGTKKRKKRAGDKKAVKRRRSTAASDAESEARKSTDAESDGEPKGLFDSPQETQSTPASTPPPPGSERAAPSPPPTRSAPKPKPKPRPRPAYKATTAPHEVEDDSGNQIPAEPAAVQTAISKKGEEHARGDEEESDGARLMNATRKKIGTVVFSDDED